MTIKQQKILFFFQNYGIVQSLKYLSSIYDVKYRRIKILKITKKELIKTITPSNIIA